MSSSWRIVVRLVCSALAAPLFLPPGGCGIPHIQPPLLEQEAEAYTRYGPIDTGTPQNFPPLQDIVRKPPLARSAAGVFTWRNDWDNSKTFTDKFRGVGWKVYRIGSSYDSMLSDEEALNIMRFCDATGAEILYTLMSKQRNQFGSFNNAVNDRLFFDHFIGFADAMIGNYGPGGSFWARHPGAPYHPIVYWEIANEPNEHYLLGEPYDQLDEDGKADLYARLLLSAYAHIRANPSWASVRVVAGSVSGGGQTRNGQVPSFDEKVHHELAVHGDASAAYDIWSIHPYVHDSPPDAEHVITVGGYSYSIPNCHAEVRRVMDAHGNQDKPIWFTEIGWHRDSGLYPENGRDYHNTERQQAAYVVRLYLIALRLGVEAVHVMMDMDADRFNGGFFHWPPPLTDYESAIAARNFITLLPKPAIVSAFSDGTDGFYAYEIDPDTDVAGDTPLMVVWNVTTPQVVRIPRRAGDHVITDMLGRSIHTVSTGTTMRVKIGPCPIFVQ